MDPRKRRSRDRLYAAALELAAREPIAQLTVTQIAGAADVHRSTFYEHADSPGRLVEEDHRRAARPIHAARERAAKKGKFRPFASQTFGSARAFDGEKPW